MKILNVVGARPNFMKMAPIMAAYRAHADIEPMLVHTGQHYDFEMSQVFFDELGIGAPHANLEVGSGRHGEQTAHMLQGIEEHLLVEKPDWVVIYGDTNSTLAGALAAVKLRIRLAHVEAGLRSFNREMPVLALALDTGENLQRVVQQQSRHRHNENRQPQRNNRKSSLVGLG